MTDDDEQWTTQTYFDQEFGIRKRPCTECPWSKTSTLGRFPAHVYEASRKTSVQPDPQDFADAGGVQELFACHMSQIRNGHGATCAGFLASAGEENFSVRIRVIQGKIPASSLRPGPDWPELYESYDAMCHANHPDVFPSPDQRNHR